MNCVRSYKQLSGMYLRKQTRTKCDLSPELAYEMNERSTSRTTSKRITKIMAATAAPEVESIAITTSVTARAIRGLLDGRGRRRRRSRCGSQFLNQ